MDKYTPIWHWKQGIENLNLIQEYRKLGKLGIQQVLMEDDLKHHQPIYWAVGLGDRQVGKAVIGRISYLMMFPFWLVGRALIEVEE